MITWLVAAQLFAACSSGDDLIVPDDNLHPISFSTADTSAQVTRADNTEGLQTLGINEIKVYGYKTLNGQLQNVMPGYTLRYQDGTANSSTSNSTGWEYVGLTDDSNNPVTDYKGQKQEIKYWDGNSSDYRFFGVIQNNKYPLRYDGSPIDENTEIDDTKSFSMEFKGLTYMTRTYDARNRKYEYLTYKTTDNGVTYTSKVEEKDIPMYGTMWQGDPSSTNFDYTKPVTLAFSKPYALIRLVFIRPDGSSVTQLGDAKNTTNPYAAKFNPKDESNISTDGTVDVTWSMKGSEESTTATSTKATLPAMQFDPIELSEPEKRYQAWPEYVMVPTSTTTTTTLGETTTTTSNVDYMCTVFVNEEGLSSLQERTAYVPKEFTHWKAGYEYTYVFKITYNNSLEFSHVVEVYSKWQAGYVDTTKW